jgi:hypothetical protein
MHQKGVEHHERQDKPLPVLTSDAEAERFVDEADLTTMT